MFIAVVLHVVAVVLHVVAVVIWVGGMFFAYGCLRPAAAAQLEPPARLTLWAGVFERFFPWVWAAIIAILASGFWLIFGALGGMGAAGVHIHIMLGLGVLMMLIFLHVFFAPYRRLTRAVAARDWPAGGKALSQIRILVGINTVLGLLTTLVGAGGRYIM